MSGPLLRLRGVSRTYGAGTPGAVEALKAIDLDVQAGEFVAIVGPSGGGKSTLLAVLGLLDVPTAGTYAIDGVQTATLTDRQRTRLRAQDLGFVFQAFHLLDRRPLIDSAEMGLLYRGLSPVQRRQRAMAALARLGLAGRESALARDLSGGQRQRVAIARAVAGRTRIILADEPTGNLDSHSGQAVLDELRSLHADGATVIVVTHSDDVAHAAERRIRISDGAIVSDSGPAPASTPHTAPPDRPGDPPLPDAPLPDPAPTTRPDRMRWTDLLRDAVVSVASRGVQSLALILAVALAVGLIVVSLGLGQTARAQVTSTFNSHTNRDVAAQIVTSPGGRLDEAAAIAPIRHLAGVDAVAALTTRGPIHVTALGGTATVSVRLVSGDLTAATESRITWAGARPRRLDARTILIGRTLARNLGLGPLDATPTVTIDDTRLAIVGIVDSSNRYPDLAGQIIADTGTPLTDGAWEQDTTIALRVATGAAQQVGRQLPVAVDPYAPTDVTVDVPVDASTVRQSIESGVRVALTAFTVLAVLIAVATLANAIGMAVIARRGEFGLRRAVGAQARHVAALVACESAIIGLIGGIVGLVLGMAGILGFTISQRWIPVFDLRLAPLAVASGITLAILASIIGAVRAARIRPAIALRQ